MKGISLKRTKFECFRELVSVPRYEKYFHYFSILFQSYWYFSMNESLQLKLMAEAKLPTEFGDSKIIGFEEMATGRDHVALVYGDITTPEPVLSRIHSECLTGDTFFSLKCDCGHQLAATLAQIGQEGRGVLLYHRQEGRGIGLVNKIRAYALQDKGLDTVEANLKLGFKPDERDFTICADMFKLLGVKNVRLITNNPQKVDIIMKAGINVVERVSIEVGQNHVNENYLRVKAEKLGHLFGKVMENEMISKSLLQNHK